MQLFAQSDSRSLDPVQRFSMVLMSMLVLVTFVGTNMQALLWQSSDWLVSTVLPAVVIDLTNNERVENSRSELIRSSALDQAAQAKAQHMADNEYFSHYAPDGTTPWKFFQDEGYVYAHAGENLAIHFTDSNEVVEAWMLSPAHRKNIVDSKFREIGVGTARGTFDGYDTVYVVQLFGTPAATPVETVVVEPEISTIPPESAVVTPTAVSPAQVDPALIEPVEIIDESESFVAVESGLAIPEIPVAETVLVDDVLVIETRLATSSGLAMATLIEPANPHAGATVAAIATQPHLVLQIFYGVIATLIIASLLFSMVAEARRLHYIQVAYSVLLLVVMGGLWFLHSSLTSGAVVM